MVYADSLSAVSAPKFRFTEKTDLLKQFDKSFTVLSALPCDILITPHPEASAFWQRLEKRDAQGQRDALLDPAACGMYVEVSRERLRKRRAEASDDRALRARTAANKAPARHLPKTRQYATRRTNLVACGRHVAVCAHCSCGSSGVYCTHRTYASN
jgi:hypothetical protein